MKTLALEFSSSRRSVAVLVEGVMRGEAQEAGGRHTRAFALMDVALRAAKIEREEIELIAVGLGPGSYTGIRSAIAIAQGWQAAREVKLAGVNSVEAMASQATWRDAAVASMSSSMRSAGNSILGPTSWWRRVLN